MVAVFIALSAPRAAALWACVSLGLLLDLAYPVTAGDNRVLHLIGPYALGYLAGGWVIVQWRTMVFRRRALTVGVMSVVFVLIAQIIVVCLYAVRSRDWYPGEVIHWSETSGWVELGRRTVAALYTGIFAIPAGWLLIKAMPLWGFEGKGLGMRH